MHLVENCLAVYSLIYCIINMAKFCSHRLCTLVFECENSYHHNLFYDVPKSLQFYRTNIFSLPLWDRVDGSELQRAADAWTICETTTE